MEYSWLRRKINTIGVWYFVTLIEEVLKEYALLKDSDKKKVFIENHRMSADEGIISESSATSKVNAMLAIIRSKKVLEAVQIIIKETSPKKVPKNTIENAIKIRESIQSGRIAIPR
jgi:hypothetical protein